MKTNNWLEFIQNLRNDNILINIKFFIKVKHLIEKFNKSNLDIKIIRVYASNITYNKIGFNVASNHYNSALPLLYQNYNNNFNNILLLEDENNFAYSWNTRCKDDYKTLYNSLVSINQTEVASKLKEIFDLILKAQGKQ